MKKFVWMMVAVMVGTATWAEAQTAATNNLTPPPPAKKAAPKTAPKKTADKKKPAPKAAPVAPAETEKPIVLIPGPETISGDHVNVRGQATFIGEIIKRLNKGDSVTVIEQVIRDKPKAGEPAQWAKIAYPAGANVWVHNTYVSNNVVVPKKLNVRAGPGENYSVVGSVERGTAVKEVSRKANWVEIEPPAGAFAFLAAKYVKQEGKIPDVSPIVTVAEPAHQPPVPVTLTNLPDIAKTTDDTNSPIAVLVPDGTEKSAPPPAEPPPRVVSHEGIVRATVSIQAPTKYEIWDPTTRMSINYLYSASPNLNLTRYRGLRVIVTGEEGLDERWRNTPVLTIQKIQVIE